MSGHPTRVSGSRSFCGARQLPSDETSDRSHPRFRPMIKRSRTAKTRWIRSNFLYAVKGGPLRVPPRGPGLARRACGLSGPTRRASQAARRRRAAPEWRQQRLTWQGGVVPSVPIV